MILRGILFRWGEGTCMCFVLGRRPRIIYLLEANERTARGFNCSKPIEPREEYDKHTIRGWDSRDDKKEQLLNVGQDNMQYGYFNSKKLSLN